MFWLVKFGQIFAFFLGTFIVDFEYCFVDFEYYLFIVNATLRHNFLAASLNSNIEKSTILYSEGLKRGTKRLSMKNI